MVEYLLSGLNMNSRLICLAILLILPACNRLVDQPKRKVESSPQAETREGIDFDDLLTKIKNCNEQELDYFNQHWNEIYKQLKHAADNAILADLPMSQQEELWNALSYLQGCRDGNIMREQGDDMVKILFTFGTQDQLALLREIHPNNE
jgi:hypothetical protein